MLRAMPTLFERSMPPHIVLVLVGELGWGSVGYHGAPVLKSVQSTLWRPRALGSSGCTLRRAVRLLERRC